ncbi:MAG: ATP-binding protein [Bacteroidales bacterium]|jgi:two-component system sensor histidine kinase/response regulator|nr:ATP-binding protein [Bacteroidales bacterium]
MVLNIKEKNSNSIKERIDILKDVIIFSESNKNILKRLASSLLDVFIVKDQAIFHKGDQQNAMYIIVNGNVKVHDEGHIFAQLKEKDFFGEYSLIDSSVRSATVTATENTHLLCLDQIEFQKIMDDNPDVSRAVLKALIKRLRNNNISEEKLAQNTIKIAHQRDILDNQKKELEELNATKDKFFTIIAHDLKNPFNTVIGLSELLIERYESYDSKKIKEFINQIYIFSTNAYNLLEDLLQWARSQTGKMEVKLEKINIFDLARENTDIFLEIAEKKGVILESKITSDLYAFIDRNMITTVLRNLISNSIKFTNSNDIISLEAKVNKDFIEISVIDSGVGIPKNSIDKIFKIDSNISTQGTKEETGTGLGLIISSEFVEKNGGTIIVKSEEGEGTQFMFTVPLYKD